DRDRREHGGGGPEQQHGGAKEVSEAHQASASASRTALKPATPSTTRSARSTISGGPSSERSPTRTACPRRPSPSSSSSASKASRSVTSSPANSAALTGQRSTSAFTAWPLSMGSGGRTSSTLRPQWTWNPASSAASAISLTLSRAESSSGAPRQW